ncbi:DNA polymerase III subunit beta [candidate division WWE3 bacterium]|uniref:Beta sliding clamp n=1 Tax=candidate division WWE3 bacterium TaxID=2053526 RepID=A0A7X9DLC8_UNCKA|nr:DNA polymerase III subunit beta [candidate division WWE3 bacterium]
MKISCLQENLAKGLNTVSRAVAAKAPMPVLGNILLATEDGRLKLAATNLETTVITYIGCSVQDEGSITVPARLLKEFVINLPAGTLSLSTEHDILHVKSDKTKSKFNGINADEFPELPSISFEKNYVEIDPKVFALTVSLVAFAAGSDDTRPIFTGVYINFDGENMTIASTDGFRLSEKILKTNGKAESFSAVVPAKTLLEISKIYSGAEQNVKMAVNTTGNMVFFHADDTFVTSIILDGQYPDYKRIVPKESVLNAIFSSQDFVEAVKLTNIFAKEGNNTIKVRFDPEGKIRINTLAEESGEHESEIAAEIEGELMEIAFNSKYLLDYLNNVKTEKITLKTSGNVSPCLFQSEENTEFFHIIMPMQI